MKYLFKFSLILMMVLIAACNHEKKTVQAIKPGSPVFLKGELLNSDNFSGTVWLHMMGAKDSTLHARFGNVSFEPSARTNWHSHPGGQVLFITEGQGYYQALEQPARILRKGDHVEIPQTWCTGMVPVPILNSHTLPLA